MATYMLLAGSDLASRQFLEDAAGKLGFACRTIDRPASLGADLEQPSGGKLALIVLDLDMPGLDASAMLRQIRQNEAAPIIVLSSPASAESAREALHEGACDNLLKPLTADRTETAMRNALKISVLEEEVARLKRKAEGKLAWSDIIAVSAEMHRTLSLAKRAADLDIPVLVEGERGTGRELIAKAIHAASPRAGGRFVTIDLREHGAGKKAATDTLLDALWSQGEGGTVFIKEIGELSPNDQERLAQLLSRRKAGPGVHEAEISAPDVRGLDPSSASSNGTRRSGTGAGSTAGQAPAVRLICSSSLDLIALVKNRQFREDLFYLINVFPIWIPPLRDRPDDLAHLVWHALARFAAEEGRRIQSVHPDALALLKSYSWPGNVRQLENAVYRAVILAEGDQIRIDDLPQIAAQLRGFAVNMPPAPALRFKEAYRGPAMFGSPLAITAPAPYNLSASPLGIPALTEQGEIRPLTEIEADLIRLALGHYRGHITEVARRLGIGRSTLYRKMREFGLDLRHNSV